jgi:hypothetical protein
VLLIPRSVLLTELHLAAQLHAKSVLLHSLESYVILILALAFPIPSLLWGTRRLIPGAQVTLGSVKDRFTLPIVLCDPDPSIRFSYPFSAMRNMVSDTRSE